MVVVLTVAAICVLAVAGICLAGYLSNRPDRRDPFAGYGLTVNAAEAESLGYGPMPPEIAHEWPGTSPAPLPSPPAPAREGPGAAAAAHVDPSPPGSVPPPLPDPAYAAAHPTAYPLAWLESDTFVTGLRAIRAIRVEGDADWPLSAPSEYLHEMEDAP